MRVEGAVVLDLANLLLGQLAGDDVHHELAGNLLVHLGSGHVDRVVERPEEVRLPAHHRRPAIEDRLVLVLPIEAPDGLQVLFRDVRRACDRDFGLGDLALPVPLRGE